MVLGVAGDVAMCSTISGEFFDPSACFLKVFGRVTLVMSGVFSCHWASLMYSNFF